MVASNGHTTVSTLFIHCIVKLIYYVTTVSTALGFCSTGNAEVHLPADFFFFVVCVPWIASSELKMGIGNNVGGLDEILFGAPQPFHLRSSLGDADAVFLRLGTGGRGGGVAEHALRTEPTIFVYPHVTVTLAH